MIASEVLKRPCVEFLLNAHDLFKLLEVGGVD